MKPAKVPTWANEPTAEPIAQADDLSAMEVDSKPQGELSDLEWMKQRMSNAVDDATGPVFEQSDDEDSPKAAPKKAPVSILFSLPFPHLNSSVGSSRC